MTNRKAKATATADAQVADAARDYAKQNIEQVSEAYEQFLQATTEVQETMLQSSGMAAVGADDFTHKAMEYTKSNMKESFDLARKLVDATDLTEVTELQSNFARNQMEAFGSQARVLTKLMSESTEKLAKTK